MDGAPEPDWSADVDAGELAVERAYAVELAELDRMALDALEQGFPPEDDDAGSSWDEVPRDEALAVLGSHPSDLIVLAALDPQALDRRERVIALGALDRAEALIASIRAEVLVAVAGERPASTWLSEVHVEHEVALARGTSRYAAGRAIDTARSLATVFPGFAAALRSGETTEAHCRMLVEKTRTVADELHCSKRPVVERATGELVGYAGFDVMEFEGAQWLELGYRLIRSARGKGYATEACATILAQASVLFGGEVLGVVDPANSASKRVLDKVGFRYWKRATIGDEVDVYHRELDGW